MLNFALKITGINYHQGIGQRVIQPNCSYKRPPQTGLKTQSTCPKLSNYKKCNNSSAILKPHKTLNQLSIIMLEPGTRKLKQGSKKTDKLIISKKPAMKIHNHSNEIVKNYHKNPVTSNKSHCRHLNMGHCSCFKSWT